MVIKMIMNEANRNKILEPLGFIIAAVTFLVSLMLFYFDTNMFTGSLFAAIMSSGLAWATYIILRWALLAFREK